MGALLPKNEILLWKLLLTGEKPTLSQLKPSHTAKERKPLEENGLIEYETVVENKKRLTRVVLTDKAWDWAATKPPTAIARSRSPEAAVVLQKALEALVAYLQREGVPLAVVLQQCVTLPSPAGLGARDPDLPQKVLRACEEMDGRWQLVFLKDLRKRFPDVPRKELDEVLLEMDRQGVITLRGLDDPLAITPEIDAAAINLWGYKKYALRVRN